MTTDPDRMAQDAQKKDGLAAVRRWLKGFVEPPLSRVRVATLIVGVVIALTVAGSLTAFFVKGTSTNSELGSLAGDYFAALGRGDGERAFQMLCQRAREETSPDDLADRAQDLRGLRVESDSLRGSGTGWWPWAQDGHGAIRVAIQHQEQVLYIEMRIENGRWKVCPQPADQLLGRPPPWH